MPEDDNRNVEERRRTRRWHSTERRQGGDRRDGAFRDFSRKLPIEFITERGTPRERVMRLLNRYCRGCSESLKADLAQALLPTLHAVVKEDGGLVSMEHKEACEAAVEHCVKKNELDAGRWDTACSEDQDK
jgi:hypothetical protein